MSTTMSATVSTSKPTLGVTQLQAPSGQSEGFFGYYFNVVWVIVLVLIIVGMLLHVSFSASTTEGFNALAVGTSGADLRLASRPSQPSLEGFLGGPHGPEFNATSSILSQYQQGQAAAMSAALASQAASTTAEGMSSSKLTDDKLNALLNT